MSRHILSCFNIENANELRAAYRLVDVEGPFDAGRSEGDLAERNPQNLVKRIQFEEQIPVALHRTGTNLALAIPAAHQLGKMEYDLTPDVATLSPRPGTEHVCLGKPNASQRGIALAFLGFALRTPLRRDNRLWSPSAWNYMWRRPMNLRDDNREIDVYRGFGLRLAFREGQLCLWVKLTHRYVESAWLPDAHDDAAIRQDLQMRFALYHYGNRWYPVQLMGPTGKSIVDQRFMPEGAAEPISVFDYTVNQVGGRNAPPWIESLDPNSAAITYRSPGNEKKRYGAASLCKLMLATEDSRVSNLHRLSILDPVRRFGEMRHVIETFFGDAAYEGTPLRVSTDAAVVPRRVFAVPVQEFGQGRILRVGRNESAGEGKLQDLGRKRFEMLLDPSGGVAVTSALDAQYLLVPESQERQIVEDFQDRLEKTARGLLQRSFSFKRVLYRDKGARTLKQQVDAVMSAVNSAGVTGGRGVLMLPRCANYDLHAYLKRRLRDRLQFQCVAAEKVGGFYGPKLANGRATYTVREELRGRYVSYLRYTAIGHLLVNRQWPWVLADGTHYDMYIGLDVLHNTAAFTFFSEGGRQCHLQSVDSQQKEKLLRKQVRTVVLDQLKNDLRGATRRPRSIILRRDGRAFYSEWLGFKDAIEALIQEGLLEADTVYGMVEVHKTSAEGCRLVEEPYGEPLRNPSIGSWAYINHKEGIVCTTGFPFRFSGTVKPITVRIAAGHLDLEKVLEDTYRMSQLCWPVPDRCIRLSIDLKLCDDYLRSVAGAADDDESLFGEDDEGETGFDMRAAAGWGG